MTNHHQGRCETLLREECPKSELYYPQGSANLNDKCNFTFYQKYGLPYQKSKLKKQEWETAIDLAAFACDNYMHDAAKLICNSETADGLHSQQLLQCEQSTNTCQCLAIKDMGLKTIQPMGTTGCLATEGSFCDDSQISCGFGFKCVQSKCKSLADRIMQRGTGIVLTSVLISYLFVKYFAY